MSFRFLTPDWCGLKWSEFVPFHSWNRVAFTPRGGVYRVRVSGADRLAYVGQTGRSLRDRVSALRTHALATDMPFNDPHTAAPRLWSYRDSEAMEFEVSVAEVELQKADRMALECYLLWEYRQEARASTLCNFGRMSRQYVAPKSRSSQVRGRLLERGEAGRSDGLSAPALKFIEEPRPAWMGLSWSAIQSLSGLSFPLVSSGPGVYVVVAAAGDTIYIGQSTNLRSRLRAHSRSQWGEPVGFSVSELAANSTSTYLLEVENDLIGSYYFKNGRAPTKQFSERSGSILQGG